MMRRTDVLVLGAGAAGLMCAWRAACGGRQVAVLDHGSVPARKVRVSGGGKCNITNRNVSASNYVCGNPHFVKSALARFDSGAVLDLLQDRNIACEERTHGRIFCRESADVWADSLVRLATSAGAELLLEHCVRSMEPETGGGWRVRTAKGDFSAEAVVVTLGGPAWPQVGATNAGFTLAAELGLKIVSPRPALAPLTMPEDWELAGLAGISVPVRMLVNGREYLDDLLFTHNGLSGPAALQASLHWAEGEQVEVDLLPGREIEDALAKAGSKTKLKNLLAGELPARLAAALLGPLGDIQAGQIGTKKLAAVRKAVHNLRMQPRGVAGWRKAEATAGGVDTMEVSSKTMQAKAAPGVFFAGEVLDVAGELGGYNLQWAFSSGHAAGQALCGLE